MSSIKLNGPLSRLHTIDPEASAKTSVSKTGAALRLEALADKLVRLEPGAFAENLSEKLRGPLVNPGPDRGAFVKESGPSFVKYHPPEQLSGRHRGLDQTGAFVKESGPSFVKYHPSNGRFSQDAFERTGLTPGTGDGRGVPRGVGPGPHPGRPTALASFEALFGKR